MALALLSTFQAHQVRFLTMGVAIQMKVNWKRTMPFGKQCGFVFQDDDGDERCKEDADFGIYFQVWGTPTINMVSLCYYHTIAQESYWKGGDIE